MLRISDHSLKEGDIEIASHSKTQYSEEYHSFVNGQNTTCGTHLAVQKRSIVKPFGFINKSFEASDVRKSIVTAISIKVMEPVLSRKPKPN
jgi:topoisomerase-4 subunit B